jgi:hypothetical protein
MVGPVLPVNRLPHLGRFLGQQKRLANRRNLPFSPHYPASLCNLLCAGARGKIPASPLGHKKAKTDAIDQLPLAGYSLLSPLSDSPREPIEQCLMVLETFPGLREFSRLRCVISGLQGLLGSTPRGGRGHQTPLLHCPP